MIYFLTFPDQFLASVSIKIIRVYQKTFSPDHSALGQAQPWCGCKFYPSCSEYGVQALQKHGFVFGVTRMLWRVIRCHPFSQGGVDKV